MSIGTVEDKVRKWARENVPEDYMYGSRMRWYGAALSKGIITQEEYDNAKIWFASTWNYTGD